MFCVSVPKEMEDMNVNLSRVGRAVYYRFFSHIFAFALVVGRAWIEKCTQQWICLFMENPIV